MAYRRQPSVADRSLLASRIMPGISTAPGVIGLGLLTSDR